MSENPVYLDCNATTPIEPSVSDKIRHFLDVEFGNAASRTHLWGTKAKQAVQGARGKIAEVVMAQSDEIIFTSGATEANNIALLGLAEHGEKTGKKHIITSTIEHKAVLEPIEFLAKRGFEVSYISVDERGWIEPVSLAAKLRDDTLLVSVMHVNNETGVIQPIRQISEILDGHSAFFHIDAAQGFGKDISTLQDKRIDLISVSAHKIYGPKGVGALVVRRRGFKRIPLEPIMYGGGHERGLRPGTLPVHLIVGFGEAASLALSDCLQREIVCRSMQEKAVQALTAIGGVINGDKDRIIAHVLNVSFPGIDSEAALVALRDHYAISNGSACTSQSYSPSHVLLGMSLDEGLVKSALRISWCHMTPEIDWNDMASKISMLK